MKSAFDLLIKIFENIPIDPEEITSKDLAKKVGVPITKVTSLINTSSSECLVGEYSVGHHRVYMYLDKKSKDKTLNFLRNGGMDEILKENEGL